MDKKQGGPLKFTRALTAGIFVVALAGTAYADDFNIVVSLDNANGWGFIPEVASASAALEHGPDVPPLGAGSANMTVNGTGRVFLGTLNLAGVPLTAMESITYWTYQKASSPGADHLAISLQFEMDYDSGDSDMSWQGRLVFEPSNDPNQDPAEKGLWQEWDARAGNWWMTGFPVVNNLPSSIAFPQSSPGSFDDVLARYPNARIRPYIGAVILKAGGPWDPGFDGNVDALSIGIGPNTFTYDFEVHEGEEPPETDPDTDGDGIPDSEDMFTSSDLRPTVFIDGHDTGVENTLFENGATISDYISELAAQAEDHGGFVSSVAHLVNALKKDGVLTNKEAAELKRCSARSSLP